MELEAQQPHHADRHRGVAAGPKPAPTVNAILPLLPPRRLRSTIVTSQMPLEQWHAVIGSPTLADAILDRLVHNAHRIELKGESMRRITARRAATTEPLDARQPS